MTIFFLMVALPGLFCVVLIQEGLKFDPHAVAVASEFILVSAPVMALLISIFYPASFSTDGIHGHSFWGTRRFIRWQDVSDARKFRLLNLSWLRIYAADNRVIWLALFQSHRAEFQQEIQRHAPAGSPVLNHLD